MLIEMLNLELKNLEVSPHSLGGWLRRVLRPVPAPVGSRSGGWAGLVMWTKRSFLRWKASAEGPERLTASPDSVMGNCHQMTVGGELLLLLSSALYHKGSSCDYRQLLPQLLIEHYLLLMSPVCDILPAACETTSAFLVFRFGNAFMRHLQTAQISTEQLFLARQTFAPRSEAAFDFPQVDRIN